jgi:predicted RNase H-like HicB family nuclease
MELTAMKEYAVVYERGGEGEENWGAYVPDLPGCITTGETLDQVREHIREAIHLHLAGLQAEGLPVPEPTTQVDRVPVAA